MTGGIGQRRVHGSGEIEVAVAVGIRTRKVKERTRRRMQPVRLKRRRVRGRARECQFEMELLDLRKCRAQHCRSGAITAEPLHAVFTRGVFTGTS